MEFLLILGLVISILFVGLAFSWLKEEYLGLLLFQVCYGNSSKACAYLGDLIWLNLIDLFSSYFFMLNGDPISRLKLFLISLLFKLNTAGFGTFLVIFFSLSSFPNFCYPIFSEMFTNLPSSSDIQVLCDLAYTYIFFFKLYTCLIS